MTEHEAMVNELKNALAESAERKVKMATATATTAKWHIDETWNAVHILFDGIPSANVRDKMKAVGFKWHKRDKYWFAKQNPKRIAVAKKICETKLKNETETGKPKTEEPEKEGAKPEKKNKYGVQVGDIFSCTWGYDQTNVDFFQVVKLCGEQSVRVREVVPKILLREAESPMSETTTYEITREILEPTKGVFIKNMEEGDLKKLKSYAKDGVSDPVFAIGSGGHLAHLEPLGDVSHFTSWWR